MHSVYQNPTFKNEPQSMGTISDRSGSSGQSQVTIGQKQAELVNKALVNKALVNKALSTRSALVQ